MPPSGDASWLRMCCTFLFEQMKRSYVPPGIPSDMLPVQERIVMQANVKQQLALRADTNFRGYQQLGSNVTRYDGGFQRDWHEAIDLYKEFDPQLSQV